MISGFGGQLVSEFFAERLLGEMNAVRLDVRRAHGEYARWRRSSSRLGPASTMRTMFETAALPLLTLCCETEPVDVLLTPALAVATVRRPPGDIVCVVTKWAERLDGAWHRAIAESIARRISWCIVTNGVLLRLIDPQQPYARRYAEFDLDAAADDERTFNLLWTILRASGAELRALIDSSRAHAVGVSRSLKDGVLASSSIVLRALLSGRRSATASPDAAFDQALTIVYRVLFLLFAEARGLVPMWHPVYRDSYSIDALRSAAERPGPVPGLWDGVRAIARLAHAGCRLGELRVTPFNGRLFSPARTPLAERADLDDEAARASLVALTSTANPKGGRERIEYRDLGVEQLGAVYETLLDYRPRIHNTRPVAIDLERSGSLRKSTGTFYTPQPIADYLVRRTLGPLCQDRNLDEILELRVVDPAMGSGAFLVAACRFLAASCEDALIRSGRHAGDIEEQERAALRRAVAERCLYGVDLNGTAVQLARLSLWLATLAADRPLTFLDHHLVVGNSLVGADLRRIVQTPPFGRRTMAAGPLPLFDRDRLVEPLRETLPLRLALELVPDDTAEQVREKERALAKIWRPGSPFERWRRVADLWCAPWFDEDGGAIGKAFAPLLDAALGMKSGLPNRLTTDLLARVAKAAAAVQFFHWELEFPEVFFLQSGEPRERPGFDAVIGNPPWEMLRSDQAEGPPAAHCNRAIDRFTRESGIYPGRGDGHVNQYQLFLDRAISLTRTGGRVGLVLPGGLTSDRGSSALRKRLFSCCDVDALVAFDNQRSIFPIHRSTRFVLLTASRGGATSAIACRFGERDASALEMVSQDSAGGSPAFPLVLPMALVERLSPDDLSVPDVKCAHDLAILERAATLFVPLGSDTGWRARFGRELNATDDRDVFRTDGRGLPIIEGKHVSPFRANLSATARSVLERNARRRLPRAPFERARLCYRDVAGPANRTTLIAALLPAGCVSTHTLFCLKTPLDATAQHFLCAMFNSFVVNHLARLRVSTHVTTAIVEALPVPTRAQAGDRFEEIAALSRALSRTFDAAHGARVNAIVAGLYQLSPAEFRHVLGAFPLVPSEERDAVYLEYLSMLRT